VSNAFGASGTYDVTLTVTDDLGNSGSVTESVVVTAPLVCGAGSAEFEDGNLTGTMAVVSDASASGGQLVQSPAGSGNDFSGDLTVGSVSVCVSVASTDIYVANVGVVAPDTSSNSWWYQVDAGTTGEFSTGTGSTVFVDQLSDVITGDDPVELNLDAGDHVFTFFVREDGTSLDNIELVRSTNVAPTASFTALCTDLSCDFDAAGSSDSDGTIESYSWDFGDSNAATGVTTSNTFISVGTYDVTLTVTDNEGAVGSSTQQITVTDPSAPTADFTFTCVSLSCDFDGGPSVDNNGTIVSYDWDFGDGTSGAGITPSRTYATGGVYDVTLTVTDDEGKTAIITRSVTAQLLIPCSPNAVEFESGVISGLVVQSKLSSSGGAQVRSLQGSGNDGGGNLNRGSVEVCVTAPTAGNYSVDIEFISPNGGSNSWWYTVNDGPVAQFSTPVSTVRATDQLNDVDNGVDPVVLSLEAGDHRFKFWVREDGAALDLLTLVPAANQEPVAAFTSSCTGLDCTFDGSGSSDLEGTIVSYNWDFGDGNSGLGETPSYTYPATGTYQATLTVTDEAGDTNTVVQEVTVVDMADPTAAFTQTCTDLDCTFDGSTSSDPNGTVDAYAWDFGDGTSATGVNPSHTYATGGTFDVTLTVTDNDGATASTTVAVTVIDPNVPTAAFTSSCVDLDCTFDGSTSSDPNGTVDAYAWDFGDGTTDTGVAPAHTYAVPGTYDVSLTVTDNDGNPNTVTQSVTATPPDCSSGTSVEFENGELTGTLQIAANGGASGGLLVRSAQQTGNDQAGNLTVGSVTVCVTAPIAGPYNVDLTGAAPNGGSNSWWWSIDGLPVREYVQETLGTQVIADKLNENAVEDPVELNLSAGEHTFVFYVREDGASLDTLTLVEADGFNDPTAAFTSSCDDLVCDFDGSGSFDVDGSIVTYSWAFGDGNSATGVTPSYTYAGPGTYDVTLIVVDDSGVTDSVTNQLTVTGTPNALPTAVGTSTCTDLACTFDGTGSTDTDGTIVSYEWDFGDGNSATGATASHTYGAAGTFAATLTVTDDRGGSNTVAVPTTVTDPNNVAPTASFTESCTDLTCLFDGVASDDTDGTIVSYAWDFGDGASDTVVSPSHTYGSGGTFDVTLTVTDDDGSSASATQAVTVIDPTGPQCPANTVEFESGDVTGTVQIENATNASGGQWVRAPQGSGNDSNGTRVIGSVTVCVQALNPGNYTVDLDMTAPDAGSNSWFFSVNGSPGRQHSTNPPSVALVVDELNHDNVADPLTLSLDAGDHTFVFWPREDGGALDRLTLVPAAGFNDPVAILSESCTDLTCVFDGSNSFDNNGSILSYTWSFGDGNTATGPNPTHTYSAGGIYDVTLIVVDNDGISDSATVQVEVIDPNGPTAAFTQTCVNTACDFDGSTSSDPDGTVVSWDWDFGDGTTASGVTPSHTYALSGTYDVALTVTDNTGASQTTTIPVTVIPPGCGTLEAEAELGELNGNFIATTDGDRGVAVAPNGTGSSSASFSGAQALGYVEMCFTVEVAGQYELRATLRGPSNGDNSFWVTVDNHLFGQVVNYRYDDTGSAYIEDFIRRYTLDPGDHTVRFWVREDGSILDSARFVPNF
jgi:PKD repeat protein